MNEAIIQSVHYSDLLKITLAKNQRHFDRVVVYTVAGDSSIDICKELGVEYVETDLFYKGGAKFNRGAVYNLAFQQLRHKEWVTIIDSDIVLPDNYREQFDKHAKEKECLYGARRYNVETQSHYESIVRTGDYRNTLLYRGYGYGYLQAFHYKSAIFQSRLPDAYPEWHDGSTADWVFRNAWGDINWLPDFNLLGHNESHVQDPPNGQLRCLPFHVIHLGITGVNATGRFTPKWET